MSDLVRVKLVDGDNVRYATVGKEFAEANDLAVVKDMAAVDARGLALDAKPHLTAAEAAKSKSTNTNGASK